MKILLRGWTFVAFAALALAVLESCAGHALAPTSFAPGETSSTLSAPLPDNFQSNSHHAGCPSGSLQPGWIFGGACSLFAVKVSGAKPALPQYGGYAVRLQIPHNDAVHNAKLRIVDATGNGDIRPYKGKNFPLYPNAFLYFKIVNTEKAIVFSKGGSVSFEIVTASAVFGSPCTIATLNVKKGTSTWHMLPVGGTVNGKDLSFDVPGKDDRSVPKGEQYFAFACQTSPTPTPSPTPSPTPTPANTPFPSPSPTGIVACTAPSLGFGTYTSIMTVGNAVGHTYTQTNGTYVVDTYSAATPTPPPTPTPTPPPTPTPGPTPTPVMVTVYYGEYMVQSFMGTSFMGHPFTAASTLGCFELVLLQPPGGTIGQLRFRSSVIPEATASINAFGQGFPPTSPTDNSTLEFVGSISSLTIDNLTTTTGNGTLTLDNGATGTVTLTGSVTEVSAAQFALFRGRRILQIPKE
jgi:hypothetical protein